MAVELLRYIAEIPSPLSPRHPLRYSRGLSTAEVLQVGNYALEVLEIALDAIPRAEEGVRRSCVELCLRGCGPFITALLQELSSTSSSSFSPGFFPRPGGDLFFSGVGEGAVLALFRALPQGGEEALLPYALWAAIRLIARIARGGKREAEEAIAKGGRTFTLDDPSPLGVLCDYFTRLQAPAYYIAAPHDSPADRLSGGLLLFLALMLTPAHGEDSRTAPLTARFCGGGLHPAQIRQTQQDWLRLSGSAQRRALWRILHYYYYSDCYYADARHRLERKTTPQGGTSPALSFPLPSHLHQAIKANVSLMCAMALKETPRRELECEELARVLYDYGISPSTFAQVNGLLTRWMGFAVETTSLIRIVEGVSRMAPNAPWTARRSSGHHTDAIVVIGVSALTKLDDGATAGDDAPSRGLGTFINQTFRPFLSSSDRSFHVTLVLTYKGLLYLKNARDASVESRRWFSGGLLGKLRDLAQPAAGGVGFPTRRIVYTSPPRTPSLEPAHPPFPP
ncbi:unnamed protein product [Phytomonas sp. Hart1]|nr:unnamed protein product [Phytomonas sp. Hart1]|eukprot:CCW66899.1 unnamed protein product [Phytomonas sp. isolate Hart1]